MSSSVPFEQHRPEDLLGPLNDIERKNAPAVLHTAGDIGLLQNGPRVSVVGSRSATPNGLKRAEALSAALVERGMVVVSGLADGIDAAAHTTAISSGGRTIAVLGTPLEECFPRKNQELQGRIMREHLAISQFAPGTPSQRKNFPMRNRTMALVSDATVIVEAAEKSGTLHQGWEALRLGRLLFLMESLATREDLSWPKEMIGYGAQVLSRENLGKFLDYVPERSRGEVAF